MPRGKLDVAHLRSFASLRMIIAVGVALRVGTLPVGNAHYLAAAQGSTKDEEERAHFFLPASQIAQFQKDPK
jgi:hypothetical protein